MDDRQWWVLLFASRIVFFFSLWLIKANTSHVLEFPVSGEKESAESEAVGVSHMIKSKMIEQVLFFFLSLTP